MKTLFIALFTLSTLLLTACQQQEVSTDQEVEKLLKEIKSFSTASEKMEKRIASLEKTNRMLEGEINVLKEELSQVRGTDEDGDLNERVAEIVNEELGELITKKIDEQAGGEGLTQQMLVTSWNQQMTAYEEQREAEEQAIRDERRKQEEERRAEMQAARLVRMAEELGIDDTQAEQLQIAMETVREQHRELFTSMRETGGVDPQVIREEMEKIRAAHLAVTAQFLNQEQQTAYTEMGQRMGFEAGGGGPRGRGGRGGRGR